MVPDYGRAWSSLLLLLATVLATTAAEARLARATCRHDPVHPFSSWIVCVGRRSSAQLHRRPCGNLNIVRLAYARQSHRLCGSQAYARRQLAVLSHVVRPAPLFLTCRQDLLCHSLGREGRGQRANMHKHRRGSDTEGARSVIKTYRVFGLKNEVVNHLLTP